LTQRAPEWDRKESIDPLVAELEAPFGDIARRCLRSAPDERCSLREVACDLQLTASAPAPVPEVVETVSAVKLEIAVPRPSYRRLLVGTAALVSGVIVTGVILAGAVPFTSRPGAGARPSAPAARSTAYETAVATPVPEQSAADSVDGASTVESQSAVGEPDAGDAAADVAAGDPVGRFVPDVPKAILERIRGVVRVKVRIRFNESGDVVEAELASPPGSRYFDKMAQSAARRWKFQPVGDGGSAVEGTRTLRFEFWPEGCDASADPIPPN
jgi:TonB family protein